MSISQAVSSHAQNLKPWIATQPHNGHLRPFFRAHNIWSAVKTPAGVERKGLHINAGIIDEGVRISNLTNIQEVISLHSWRQAAFQSIVEFKASLNALLPANSSQLVSDFPLDKIVDNYEPSAIHMQVHNKPLLDPLRDHLRSQLFTPNEPRHQLFSSAGIMRNRVEMWLDLDQILLGRMAAALSLSNALIVSEGHFKRMQFDSSGKQQRNLWILPSGLVVLSNPMAVMRMGVKADLFLFPLDMARMVIFYFTIIRPIACIILELINKQIPCYGISIWTHHTHHAQRNGNHLPLNWLWSGQEISHYLRILTFKWMGFSLTPAIIHAITKSIFEQGLPSFFDDSEQNSIVDDQAQHLTSTSIIQYGRLCHFPPFTNIRSDRPIKYVAVQQLWQVILGLGPVNEVWHALSIGSGLFSSINDECLYLEVARGAVNIFYGLGSGLSDCEKSARALLVDSPFMQGLKVAVFFMC